MKKIGEIEIELDKVKTGQEKISDSIAYLGIEKKDIEPLCLSLIPKDVKDFRKRFQVITNDIGKVLPAKTYPEAIVKFFKNKEKKVVSLKDFLIVLRILRQISDEVEETISKFKIRFNA